MNKTLLTTVAIALAAAFVYDKFLKKSINPSMFEEEFDDDEI